jgi:hypothetical protein
MSNWDYASNTALWTSNYVMSGDSATRTGYASNTATWDSNNFSNYAPSNAQSNWDYASNLAVWTSNYVMSGDSATRTGYASNTATWDSNNFSNYALSNAQSNWNFASNAAAWASNEIATSGGGGGTGYASNTATWDSNNFSNYALSNGQSNWDFASNLAVWASNEISASGGGGGTGYASNTATWDSNNFSNYAPSNGQSNWDYGSNTAYWASNNVGSNYWVKSGTDLYTNASSVGIGTTDPIAMLHVDGKVLAKNFCATGIGAVTEASAMIQYNRFGNGFSVYMNHDGGDVGGHSFGQVNAVGNYTERMRLSPNGKIGGTVNDMGWGLSVLGDIQACGTTEFGTMYATNFLSYRRDATSTSADVLNIGYKYSALTSGGGTISAGDVKITAQSLGSRFGGEIILEGGTNVPADGRILLRCADANTITLTSTKLTLIYDNATKASTSTWNTPSDRRLKEDIISADLDVCYANVRNIPLAYYKWRDDVFDTDQVPDRHKLGWIAQDVETVFPKAVSQTDNFGYTDCRSLNTDQIYASMYGAIQKLMAITESQNETIADLKARITILESM